MLLAYVAFISLGLPDAVLGVAWPSLRDTFGLSQALLGGLLALGAAAYFASGLFAGRLQQSLGIGRLLAGSTALVAAGVAGYAVAPVFAVFALIAPLIAFGSGAIDAALNTYAARHFRPRQMTWLHAAYAAGAMAGPAVMTGALARGASWRAGYGVVAAILAAAAVGFLAARRRWDAPGGPVLMDGPAATGPVPAPGPRTTAWTALRSGRVWLQIVLFFLYTGIEVSAGQWSFTLLTEGRGVDTVVAGTWVAAYWGGLLAGRVALGFLVEHAGQVVVVRVAMGGVLLFAVLFALPGLSLGAVALPLLSFSLASIYPGLMSETPRRVGPDVAAHAVGFQVSAATVGVAVLPSLCGLLGARFGLQWIPWVIVLSALLLLAAHELLVARTDRPASARAP